MKSRARLRWMAFAVLCFAGLALLALQVPRLLSGLSEKEASSRPNILVFTLCSVRPDHLGRPGITPTIDQVAKAGTVFAHAWSPATFTLPAHASLLTGLTPSRAGVLQATDHLPTTLPTLPEVLGTYGYDTYAWTSVASAASFRKGEGLERGFAHFVEGSEKSVLAALNGSTLPYFALLHLKHAHKPYGSRNEADPRLSAWLNHPLLDPRATDPNVLLARQVREDPALAALLSARYDQAVSQDDVSIGIILRDLELRGRLKNTVVVIAGDHGESLGEDEIIGHHHLTPVVSSIPLIVWLPSSYKAISRINADASLVDLMPTLLSLAGAVAPAGLDGQNLLPRMLGEQPDESERVVLAQNLTREAGQPQHLLGEEAIIRWPYWLRTNVRGIPSQLFRMEQGAPSAVPVNDPTVIAELGRLRAQQAPIGWMPTEPTPVSKTVEEEIRKAGYW